MKPTTDWDLVSARPDGPNLRITAPLLRCSKNNWMPGRGRRRIVHDPIVASQREALRTALVVAMPQLLRGPWCGRGPCRVEFRVGPSSVTITVKPEPSGLVHRPDLDNVVSTYLDALIGLAYADDSQVCSLAAERVVEGVQ